MVELNCFNIKKGYYCIDENGNIYSNQTGDYMKPQLKKDGYYTIGLRTNNKEKKYFRIHRLVAETFIPHSSKRNIVNHIDGDKINNHVSNLEWVTLSENSMHSIHILKNIPVVTNEKSVICKNLATGEITIYPSISECARNLNCTFANISAKLSGTNSNPSQYGRLKNLFFKFGK